MGSPETENDRSDDEGPVHKVTLSPFRVAKYEVSRGEWKRVMGRNPSNFKGDDTLPVDRGSWGDYQVFCEKTGLSLPTEAQWEYACRAGTSGPYAGTGNLDDMGWYDKNSFFTPQPIGEKKPNDFGLHDMHGNIWEWCEDWYQKDFYQESTGAIDPLCENSGSGLRVARGGDVALNCRSACRLFCLPSIPSLGFRPTWSTP